MSRRLMILVLLAAIFAPPAGAVDTLDVKATVKGQWTTFPSLKVRGRGGYPAQDGSIWWRPSDGAVRYDGTTWTKYTSDDGLMDGPVRSIAQAPDGVFWFAGSHRGKAAVTRYDGRTWRIYTEADGLFGSYVGGISAIDTHGNLWLSTETPPVTDWSRIWADRTKGGSGVLRFDGKTWRNFRIEDGLAHNRVSDIAAGPDGSVWVATYQGVSRFDGKSWTTYTKKEGLGDPKISCILVARDGKVWCIHGGTPAWNWGLSVFDGTTWKRINEADGMPEARVWAIYQAEDGTIWFGTEQYYLKEYGIKGLLRYQDGAWLRILREDGLPGDNVHSITEARDGSLWLTVPDVGLVRYRPDFTGLGMISGTVRRPDGSPWVDVGMRVEDKMGQARAGAMTDANGRYQIQVFPGTYQVSVINSYGAQAAEVMVKAGEEIQKVDFAPLYASHLGKVVPAGPGTVVPAGSGTVVPAGAGTGHWRTYDVTDGLPSNYVRSMFQDREGCLWLSVGHHGVVRYDGESFATFTKKDGLAGNSVRGILEDGEGRLWFGTLGGGVSRYDGKTFTTFTATDGLASNYVTSGLQDREGNLWFGFIGGVSRYDGKTWTTFTEKDGLEYASVRSIFQDREGHLWFGSVGGMSRYDGKTWTTFTEKDGLAYKHVWSIFQDREGYLWFAADEGVSRYDGKTFTTFTEKDGLADRRVRSILQDGEGYLWFATDEGVSRYDGKTFTTFTKKDGLADNRVASVFQDREGHLWFGTSEGVSRYDGQTWTTFAEDDGLPANPVVSIFQDRERHLWFGTPNGNGGVSRYDGKTFTTFTTTDGLASNSVRGILEDGEGRLWFATNGGVSRYDGKTFTTFTKKDGLPNNSVGRIFQDREGNLWFATDKGVSRYDGKTWTTFTTTDGLADDRVYSVLQDREGNLWFGTFDGASRYDGKTFTTFTTTDGLADNHVHSLLQDREGNLWFGTTGGVSRYDGRSFATFTREDGLAGNGVKVICQDREGYLWFGTDGGVSQYDGQVFQRLTRQDGLTSNSVYSILQDQEGNLWFGGTNGMTRFRPSTRAPSVSIGAVVADQRYEKATGISIPSSVRLTAFEFHAISLKTRPGEMVYRYRLKGHDKHWKNTRERRVEYQDLPRGVYTFQVQAVDRDLVYSGTPAKVILEVHLPYERIAWASALSIAIALGIWQTVRVVRRDRRLREEAEKELQVAHDMQMGLLPRASPQMQEVDLSGTCIPANHVGGDYYQFLYLNEARTKLAIVLADVSGHAMQAATVAMRFNEMLRYEIEGQTEPAEILKGLDASLRGHILPEMFVTCGVGVLDVPRMSLTFASAANPEVYRFSKRDGRIQPLGLTGFPLGLPLILQGQDLFQAADLGLESGDVLVFTSDGVEEAQDGREGFYEGERLRAAIQSSVYQYTSAEEIRDEIVADVKRFMGAVPQMDDITVVVLRVV